jgi:protoporphyrinogen oxidase
MHEKTIIIGGGISGLTLAWKLAENGVPVTVLEAKDTVGGLARTVRHGGCGMDVGPHSFFSEDKEIIQTVLDLFDGTLKSAPRQVKFYYEGRYLDYPLTASTVLFQMGYLNGLHSVCSFLKSRLFPHRVATPAGEDETVEDWALSSFGKHLYQTFFKPYTEQFWKISCSKLSARSIPTHTRMSFLNTLKLLFLKRLKRSGGSLVEREMLPTYYPPTGYGEITDRVADAARAAGATIRTSCCAEEVLRTDSGTVKVRCRVGDTYEEFEGERLVSTIPLHLFVRMLQPLVPDAVSAAAEKLDYRALVTLGMVTNKQNILSTSYMYMLNRPFNRITEMNKFSPQTSPPDENILMLEMPVLRDSLAWEASAKELFDMCIDSLAEDGFLQPGDVKDLILIKEPYAYPVYRKDYAPNLKTVLDYIENDPALSTLGRLGEFMYMDIDECMRRAFDFAEQIVKKQAFHQFPEPKTRVD